MMGLLKLSGATALALALAVGAGGATMGLAALALSAGSGGFSIAYAASLAAFSALAAGAATFAVSRRGGRFLALDAVDEALTILDRNGRIVAANAAAQAFAAERAADFATKWPGLNPKNLIGETLEDLPMSSAEAEIGEVDISVGAARLTLSWRPLDGGRTGVTWRAPEQMAARVAEETLPHAFAFARYDMDGGLIDANERFQRLMRIPEGEGADLAHREFLEEETRASEAYARMWRRLRAGEMVSGVYRRRARNGRRVWIQAAYRPRLGADGAPCEVVEIAADITRPQEYARVQKEVFEAYWRHFAMLEMRPTGEIMRANDVFLSLFGYQESELADKSHEILLHQKDRETLDHQDFWAHIRKGDFLSGIYRLRNRAGDSVWLQAAFCCVRNDLGEIARVVLMATDATAAERERRATNAARSEEERRQSLVVKELSIGLSAIAEGDVAARIETAFDEDYEQLRLDFNAAQSKLGDLLRDVVDKSGGIGGGAREISRAADDLSHRTESQAAALEETAAALKQLTGSVNAAAADAREADKFTDAATDKARSNEAIVRQSLQAMKKIETSSTQISKIVTVIDDIAFQTNLLALNAGVEAARAGDAGRGFAVVASEVRSLARRCSDAAKEIDTLITESGDHVEEGSKLVGEASAALGTIHDMVSEISGLVTRIASVSQEQATGVSEIMTAIDQLDGVTQQNAAMVEEMTAASHDLTQDSSALSDLVSRFRIDGDAKAQSIAAAAAPMQTRAPALRSVGGAALEAEFEDEEGWEDF